MTHGLGPKKETCFSGRAQKGEANTNTNTNTNIYMWYIHMLCICPKNLQLNWTRICTCASDSDWDWDCSQTYYRLPWLATGAENSFSIAKRRTRFFFWFIHEFYDICFVSFSWLFLLFLSFSFPSVPQQVDSLRIGMCLLLGAIVNFYYGNF